MTHGKRSTYVQGCRCSDCTRANTEDSRRRRRQRGARPRHKPRCGTVSGWQAHKRRGEDPCPACVEEKNADNRARYSGKTAHGTSEYRGNGLSRKHERTTSADLILDVLETYGYAMTSDVLVSHVLDIRPDWKEPSVRRALFRMVDDGRVHQFERLGEWLYDLNE